MPLDRIQKMSVAGADLEFIVDHTQNHILDTPVLTKTIIMYRK